MNNEDDLYYYCDHDYNDEHNDNNCINNSNGYYLNNLTQT